MPQLNRDRPIVLGLAGVAGTGKTITGDGLGPTVSMRKLDPAGGHHINWNHLFFALPLYEMARVRKDIEGFDAKNRMRYAIHEVLLDVFGRTPLYGAPPYKQLVDMVEEIVNAPIELEGKPRTFLQEVGTGICRAYEPECWVNWMKNKIKEDYRAFEAEWRNEQTIPSWIEENTEYFNQSFDSHSFITRDKPTWGTVISDCRFVNEARFVHEHDNGLLVKLTARPEVLAKRIEERDGKKMTKEQMEHISELQVNEIPMEWFDLVIDTSDMTIQEQVEHVNRQVQNALGE